MAKNYLPSSDEITLLNAESFIQLDGEPRPRSAGYMDSFTWSPNVTTVEKKNGNSGTIETVKSRIQEVEVEVSATLAQTGVRQMAMAMQGSIELIEQTAQTAMVITETDVSPGELIELGYLDVSNVAVTDGVAPLASGTDYILNAAAGTITVYGSAQATFEATFDAPAITAADDRNVIKVLQETTGVKGVFTLIGANPDGIAYKLEGVRVELSPSGDVAFVSNDGEFQSIELSGKGVRNPAAPDAPWGRLIPMTRS